MQFPHGNLTRGSSTGPLTCEKERRLPSTTFYLFYLKIYPAFTLPGSRAGSGTRWWEGGSEEGDSGGTYMFKYVPVAQLVVLLYAPQELSLYQFASGSSNLAFLTTLIIFLWHSAMFCSMPHHIRKQWSTVFQERDLKYIQFQKGFNGQHLAEK